MVTGTHAGKDRNAYLFKMKVIFMKKILFLFEYLGYAGDDIYKLPLISHFRGGASHSIHITFLVHNCESLGYVSFTD